MTKKDYICMGCLMLLFAVMALFQLGNMHVPETTYAMDEENTDIILDFGEYASIGTLHVFNGNLHDRTLSISVYNEVTKNWEVINGEAQVNSVFTWNSIPINYKVRYVGLVSTGSEAVFNEFAVTKTDGSYILPVNSSDYETLFDEQEMFPDYHSYLSGTMFDEVYHGRTAYEFLHGLTTYETTHPHFGKILISIGIALFGMNPFGWRIMSVLFGILIIGVMYLFAKKLFGSTFIATITGGLLTFDCMHYTLSRIATIDIFAAFFILLMYYFLYCYFVKDSRHRMPAVSKSKKHKKTAALEDSVRISSQAPAIPLTKEVLLPLALCGITMAFGVATKWTGVYAGIGLGILFIWYTLTHFPKKQVLKLFLFCCCFFILIPIIIYTLSFIPVVGYHEYDNLIDKTIKCTMSMYDYHSKLVAEHYYSTPFYEWPIIWMPLLYANDEVANGLVSSVSCMGNPAIWWVGILCVLFILYRWIIKRDKKAGFLVIAYAAQYIPWMSIGRITFIYHYFPAILFVILMIGYTMHILCQHFSYGRKIVIGYMAVVIFIFMLFFPVVSGFPAEKEWGLSLRWLKDWILVL